MELRRNAPIANPSYRHLRKASSYASLRENAVS